MTLFILAAGMGSRYGGLKQIDPFTPHGEFIIDFSIYDALQAGFDRVVFVIKKENYEVFKETVGKRIENQVKVEYVFQELEPAIEAGFVPADRVKPLGTTHALLAAEEALKNDSFIVINSDDFYGREAFFKAAEFLKNANNEENHYCMVGYYLGNTLTDNGSVARGQCRKNDEGMLDMIQERTKLFKEEGGAYFDDNGETVHLPNDTIVSMNFWAFTPTVFKGLNAEFVDFINDPNLDKLKGECLLPNCIGHMINRNECDVKVLETSSKWFGVTYADDKPDVIANLKALIESGEYPDGLWK